MSKFKIGDKVVENSTGDTGVITERNDLEDNAWHILWETGESKGFNLWLEESKITNLSNSEEQTSGTIDLSHQEIVIAGVTYILTRK